MARYCIIGHKGFIGSALARYIGEFTTYPTKDTEYIFFMGGVVHPVFEQNEEYYAGKEMSAFAFLINYCEKHNIKLIYCSSALVSEGKEIGFVKHKERMEIMGGDKNLGLRIFPVYGPGDHNTVISQWCRDMKNFIYPVIYGDGTQVRDFIFVSDVAEQIFLAKDECGIKEIGTGIGVSFNEIVSLINRQLHKKIEPTYIPAPTGYHRGIVAEEGLPVRVSIAEGIKILCEEYD